jgi:hypothetical protein
MHPEDPQGKSSDPHPGGSRINQPFSFEGGTVVREK